MEIKKGELIRYSIIKKKNKREIVLLKGKPCIWGKCAFCDYIEDNELDEENMILYNRNILKNISGKYGALEVINSGSVFELPNETLEDIKRIVEEKNIKKLFFESYWAYKNRLYEIREFFNIPIIFKCGIETFDNNFRNNVLKKGVKFEKPEEPAKCFESICLLVGIKGQTREMIKYDIECLLKYFKYGCINIFVNNSTDIKADYDIINWFHDNYLFLEDNPSIEILWNNTDFGVGGII